MSSSALPRASQPDVLIAGGGIVGLSLALELDRRGAQVTVFERDTAMSHASTAAAGMLAASDPHNPPEVRELSQYSATLYGEFLNYVERLSGQAVPYQTDTALQHHQDGTCTSLHEHSIDPRQLASALIAAVRSSCISLIEHCAVVSIHDGIAEAEGRRFHAGHFVTATGAWGLKNHTVFPRKGQMLRVEIPHELDLREVHRNEQAYVVPRTQGPQAGTALIGATVEDAGYDISTRAEDLTRLRRSAAAMVPELASKDHAPQIEAWAGLRPATADLLPVLGFDERDATGKTLVATGHFRNGILLAPATAVVIADLIQAKRPMIDLRPFSPDRPGLFVPHSPIDNRP